MKTSHLLFSFLFALLALWLAVGLAEVPAQVGSSVHPQFNSMQKGGVSFAEHPLQQGLSLSIGICILCIFLSVLYLAKGFRGLRTAQKAWLVTGALLYLGIFVAMSLSHLHYSTGPAPSYFGGLPSPTAWMVYGIWFCPLFFSIAYVAWFDQWIFPPEDHRVFEEMVRRRQRETTQNQ
ncbi:MAG: hypothetical protein AAFV95_07500 [Bacteroidota bacterium]